MSAGELLGWYDRVARDLPWRRSRDPYRVLVAEVMLQQTRVETVLRYYDRFLAALPDVSSLAAASEERVLALWSGLGYYRRARQLQAVARAVVARGGFPCRAADLALLPGVGGYTAAAVASIAFDEPVAVLDGNVLRVAARLLAQEDAASAAARRRLRAAAAALLDPRRPGDSNQALMELGARVCVPRAPRCHVCPLANDCAARALGSPEAYPLPRQRPVATPVRHLAAVARDGAARVYLVRGARGLLEIPQVALDGAASSAAGPVLGSAQTVEHALGEAYGGRWRLGARRGTVRHGVTRYRLEVAVHDAARDAGGDEMGERAREGACDEGAPCAGGWFEVRGELAVSALVRKVLAVATAPRAAG